MTWSKLTPTNCLGGEMRHPQLHLVHRNPGRRLGAAQHILPPRPPNPRQLLPLLQPPDGARPGGGARQVAHGKSAHCDLRMSSPSTLSISLPPGSFPNSPVRIDSAARWPSDSPVDNRRPALRPWGHPPMTLRWVAPCAPLPVIQHSPETIWWFQSGKKRIMAHLPRDRDTN